MLPSVDARQFALAADRAFDPGQETVLAHAGRLKFRFSQGL
jgi:hypothetical protein